MILNLLANNLKKFFSINLKEFIAYIIVFSFIPFFIRKFIARNKVTILLYHDPKKDIMQKHLEYLNKKYNFISLKDLINAINDKNWSQIPEYPLLLTYDDGHKGNYKLIKLFEKYYIKPTIYVCTKIVNSLKSFWFKILDDKNKEILKKFSQEKREKVLKEKFKFDKDKEYSLDKRYSLNAKELKNMSKYVNFESHSRYHPILPKCNNIVSFKEIKMSKIDLKNIFNETFKNFSFPNGDYSEREIAYLKKIGYKSARTCDIGWNDFYTNPYYLKTCLISDEASITMLKAQVSGVTGYLRYLVKFGSLNGRKKIVYKI